MRDLAPHEAQLTRRESGRVGKVVERVAALEQDLGYVTLVLGSLLQKVNEKGVVTGEEAKAAMAELDLVDGLRNPCWT